MKKHFDLKHLSVLLIMLLAGTYAHSQPCKDYLLSYSETDSTGNELYGYKTINGEIVIKARYRLVYTDTLHLMATIMTPDWEVVCIDRNDSVLCRPFIFDNGPDYISEGVFRIVENGKMGFADTDGKIVIPAVFDFVAPFGDGVEELREEGVADYVMGGHRQYLPGDEYWTWAGGYESGYINHAGQRFAKISKLKNGKRKAWTHEGKRVWLDRTGNIINK